MYKNTCMKENEPTEEIDNSLLLSDLYEIVQELLLQGVEPDEDSSCFWIICLSKYHQLLLVEQLPNDNLATIHATEVFQIALQKRATTLLLCQRPSEAAFELAPDDYYFIRQLLKVGYLIRLPILDYLVLKTDGYYSLMQAGKLQELRGMAEDEAPPLTIQKAEALAQEAVEEAKQALEASYYKDKEEIALHLYEEGLALTQIISITGLSEEVVVALIEANP